jgi:hypothetical protein
VRRAARLAALVALGAVVLATIAGLLPANADADDAPVTPSKVVLISVPRLEWADVAAGSMPNIASWLDGSAYANLSIRAVGPRTGLGEGYLTVGTGNRATINPLLAGGVEAGGDGSVTTGAAEEATRDADSKLYGAEPGAFGDALAHGSRVAGVVSSTDEAVLAMMDRHGRVPVGDVDPALTGERSAAALGSALGTADVALVSIDALQHLEPPSTITSEGDTRAEPGSNATPSPAAPDRANALAEVDATFADIVAAIDAQGGSSPLVVLFSPAAPGNLGRLTVFAAKGAGIEPGEAQSATTRRPGYVTLTDIAPTVLTALDLSIPESMSGTDITGGHGPGFGAGTAHHLAELGERASYRDRSVGPMSVVYIVLQVLVYALAALAVVRGHRTMTAVAHAGALLVLAIPPIAFLSGLTAYRRLTMGVYVVAVVAVAAALAAAAWATLRRAGAFVPALALVAFGWLVQVVDIVTGGHLQIDTPFGYSPIVAGRFQGFGNLSFSLLAAAAIVLAAAAALVGDRAGWSRRTVLTVAASVCLVTIVLDGWPGFGADVGGVLALVPACAITLLILAGRRVDWKRVALVAVGAVVVLAAFALVDLQRPASDRTHLGRFVDKLLHGDGGLILRRKFAANLHILTSSIFTWLVPVAIVFLVVLARRADALARVRREVPGMQACLVGSLVLAIVGFAVNDSGVAIPAMMFGVVLPWITVLVLSLDVAPPPADEPMAEAAGLVSGTS